MDNKLNDDKSVLDNREKILDAEHEVPLRDRIIKKLFDELNDMEVGQKICAMWKQANSDRQEWMQRKEDHLSSWDEFINVEPQGTSSSSSNLHIPMPLWVLKSFHARFMQTLLSPEPAFDLKASKEGSLNLVEDMRAFIRHALIKWSNYGQGVDETIDQWVWEWTADGIGFTKWRWDTQFKKFLDVVNVQEVTSKFALNESTGLEENIPDIRIVEKEQWKVEKSFEGPVLDFIPLEDIVVVGDDLSNLDLADAVIHRQYLNASQLWTLADRKIFDEEAVTEVIESGDDPESAGENNSIKQNSVTSAGESSLDKSYDLDKYEILEAYVSMDVDGSGINSDIVVWVHSKTSRILRATYLNRMHKNGKRPFQSIIFHKRSGKNKNQPVGLIEMIYAISKELDAIHNMRIDFGLISTVPFGFYRASSSIQPTIMDIEPGKMYPVDNPQSDVFFPQLGNRTIFGLQEEQALYTMIERLTGISDLSLGVISGKQGATRTSFGSKLVASEMSTNLNTPLARLNRGWKRVLDCLLHMLVQRTPPGYEFRVTGDDDIDRYIRITDPDKFSTDFDFELSGNSEESNKQLRLQSALQIYQITSNPMDMQLGIITPENRFEAIKNLLKAQGVRNISRFISPNFHDLIIYQPEEEVERVMLGQEIPVLPQSNHERFIEVAMEVINNEQKELTQDQVILLQDQMNEHQKMLQAMQQAQAQTNNQNQIQINQNLSDGNQNDLAIPEGSGNDS